MTGGCRYHGCHCRGGCMDEIKEWFPNKSDSFRRGFQDAWDGIATPRETDPEYLEGFREAASLPGV